MNRRHYTTQSVRRAAVAVEFAICAPLLFLFFFGALEFSRMNMLRQTIDNAAYEGARRGVVPGATAGDMTAAAHAELDAVSARNATISVSPTVITKDTPSVTVDISVPFNENAWFTPAILNDLVLTSSLTLARERYDTTSVP